MAENLNISDITNQETNDPYSARARINDGSVDVSSSKVTGDRTTSLFQSESNDVGKNDFLMLLVTQLRYQDPLSPMDNMEFVQQLAQFRNLEASQNIEKAVNQLGESFQESVNTQMMSAQSVANSSAVSLIGKEVRIQDNSVEYRGDTVSINVHLGNHNSVNGAIVDENGDSVKTFSIDSKDAENSAVFEWDGTMDNGKKADTGSYTVQIEGAENDPSLYTFVQDTVSGVRFGAEGALVKVNGRELPIGKITDVSPRNSTASQGVATDDSALALLQKEVRIRVDTVQWNREEGERVPITVNMGNMDRATVAIEDSSGAVVKTMTVTADENGVGTVTWDGRQEAGQDFAEPGTYRICVVGEENNPDIYPFVEGVVDGITTAGNTVRVRIDGYTYPVSDIIDISVMET
jgi:flagellar basal-body rod modification protein FlgD